MRHGVNDPKILVYIKLLNQGLKYSLFDTLVTPIDFNQIKIPWVIYKKITLSICHYI